jgi:hypothetical protein
MSCHQFRIPLSEHRVYSNNNKTPSRIYTNRVTENFFTVAGATATNAANKEYNGSVSSNRSSTRFSINIAAIPGVTSAVRTATP